MPSLSSPRAQKVSLQWLAQEGGEEQGGNEALTALAAVPECASGQQHPSGALLSTGRDWPEVLSPSLLAVYRTHRARAFHGFRAAGDQGGNSAWGSHSAAATKQPFPHLVEEP